MKSKFYYAMFVACAVAGISLAGCNNDKNDPRNQESEGKQTFMTVSLTFPKGDTRVTSDPNATEDEAGIKTVDVFIYTGTGYFLSHTALRASDFTQAASGSNEDKYTYSAASKIETTTGSRNVYVGINLPSDLVTELNNRPMSELTTAVRTLSREQMTTVANGLPMFSTEGVQSVFVEDDTAAANNITVKVQRLVAKITVSKSATMEQSGVEGKLADITFAINNFNLKSFLIQGEDPYKDPNWAIGSYAAGDFSQAITTDYVDVLDLAEISNPGVDDYFPRYASENTSEGKTKKEITRVTVRATFIPENIYVDDENGSYETSTATLEGITTPRTFWSVTPVIGGPSAYFFDEAIAQLYSEDNSDAEIVTFANGYCYWDMFLNKPGTTDKWDVLRNDYYKCNITRMVAPGKPNPDVYPPDATPDDNTSITVSVDVLFWNTPVLADYELEP